MADYIGLYNRLAIMPKADEQDKKARKAVGERVRTYYYNGWKAIDDIDVFLSPRLRNVQALLTGVWISSLHSGAKTDFFRPYVRLRFLVPAFAGLYFHRLHDPVRQWVFTVPQSLHLEYR